MYLIFDHLNVGFKRVVNANFLSSIANLLLPIRIGEIIKFLLLYRKNHPLQIIIGLFLEIILDSIVLLTILGLLSWDTLIVTTNSVILLIILINLVLFLISIELILAKIDRFIVDNISYREANIAIKIRNAINNHLLSNKLNYKKSWILLISLSTLMWIIDLFFRLNAMDYQTIIEVIVNLFGGFILGSNGSVVANLVANQYMVLSVIGSSSVLLLGHRFLRRGHNDIN
jgi:hypothetical protein